MRHSPAGPFVGMTLMEMRMNVLCAHVCIDVVPDCSAQCSRLWAGRLPPTRAMKSSATGSRSVFDTRKLPHASGHCLPFALCLKGHKGLTLVKHKVVPLLVTVRFRQIGAIVGSRSSFAGRGWLPRKRQNAAMCLSTMCRLSHI